MNVKHTPDGRSTTRGVTVTQCGYVPPDRYEYPLFWPECQHPAQPEYEGSTDEYDPEPDPEFVALFDSYGDE